MAPDGDIRRSLAAFERQLSYNRLALYRPYSKQREFHALGATHRERCLFGANQSGKTLSLAMEVAMHATGLYPPWWEGWRFDKPVVVWCGGVTGEQTRDSIQRHLLGRQGQIGTGALPQARILNWTAARGVSGLADTILVRHVSNGTSQVAFKTYARGREPWQGESCDVVALDEEPPLDIYLEALTRTNATRGIALMVFTPLLGMSEVVRRFYLGSHPDRASVRMTILDAEHFGEEQRQRILASYGTADVEARARGIPQLGSGAVFPVAEEDITCKAFAIPDHWPQIGGLDFGWDHPTAAVRLAHDRDSDTVYVVAAYRKREATPYQHCETLKGWGSWLPWAWPHDGLQHDKQSGKQLAVAYREHGLAMMSDKATFSDGTYGFEAGVNAVLERMQTGRLKVFGHLEQWFEEFRIYHRKDGVVVKEHDDLLSATRVAVMELRAAITKPRPRPHRTSHYGGASAWAS